MKILHIHDRLEGYGGGEVYFSEVVEGLREQGHQVAKLYLLQNLDTECSQPGIHRLNKPHGYCSGLSRKQQLLDILQQESPDVVHLHCLFTPVWIKAILQYYPVVFTLHSVEALCFLSSKVRSDNRQVCHEPMGLHCITSRCYQPLNYGAWLYGPYQALLRWQLLRLLPILTRVISPSQRMAEELQAVSVQTERLVTIPHFTRLQTQEQPEFRHPNRHILFVGRLSWEKGILEFIDVLRALTTPDWTASIVGEGTLLPTIKARLAEFNLSNKVHLVGRVPRNAIGQYYRQASAVAVPSMVPEAFGLAGIEAMAFGCPVVAFDMGGVKDWLSDRQTGFLIAPGNIQQMAASLDRLMVDFTLNESMGRAAWVMVNEQFGIDRHINRLVDVYIEAKHQYELENRD